MPNPTPAMTDEEDIIRSLRDCYPQAAAIIDRLRTPPEAGEVAETLKILRGDNSGGAASHAWDLLGSAPKVAALIARLQSALVAAMAERDALRRHAGKPVTWERLRSSHSNMRGEAPWRPDTPNEGHRVYSQSPDEQCFMCAALAMIEDSEATLAQARREALAEAAKLVEARASDFGETDNFDKALIALVTYKPTHHRSAYALFADAIRALLPEPPDTSSETT